MSSFAGYSTEIHVDYRDEFDSYIERDFEWWLISKRIFLHEDDGLTFKYRYVILVKDYSDDFAEDEIPTPNGEVTMFLEVCPESLCDKVKNNIASTYGDENKVYPCDVSDYGLGVVMGREQIDIQDKWWTEQSQIIEKLNDIASVYVVMDSLRGFHIDKIWNHIGNNGWDLLDECVNGNSFVQSALSRIS